MTGSNAPLDIATIQRVAATGDDEDRRSLAERVADGWDRHREIVDAALTDPAVRRWARGHLVSLLPDEAAGELGSRLLEWTEDFSSARRDRTTGQLIARVPDELLPAHLHDLAASNAASALWERIAADGPDQVKVAALDVLSNAGAPARETTLHVLVLDPYGAQLLGREAQDELLALALDDADPEIRGLAAEVIAADMPELILGRWDSAPLDGSERVRTAFWQAAVVHHPEAAFDHASALVLDSQKEHGPRRSALIAVGEWTSTRRMAPLLQALLRGEDEVLAGDAAQLMWRHHRAPDIANAAAESRFEPVRELAERLLHPELGSPAAGGSRPGDPTRTGELFDRISESEDRRGTDPEK